MRPVTITEAPTRRSPLKERIRWARENPRSNGGERISQEKFASLIGTSRRHVMRIERGDNMPRQALISRIADATGHSEEFFSDDDEEDSSTVAGRRPTELERALDRMVQRSVRRAFAAMTTDPAASLAKATAGSDYRGG